MNTLEILSDLDIETATSSFIPDHPDDGDDFGLKPERTKGAQPKGQIE